MATFWPTLGGGGNGHLVTLDLPLPIIFFLSLIQFKANTVRSGKPTSSTNSSTKSVPDFSWRPAPETASTRATRSSSSMKGTGADSSSSRIRSCSRISWNPDVATRKIFSSMLASQLRSIHKNL